MDLILQDRVAIITGAARGLGQATARQFLEAGAFVILADVLEPEGTALAGELGNRALFMALDVSSEEQWDRAIDAAIAAFGRIDILVNNAGVSFAGPLESMTLAANRRCFEVNEGGVFLGMTKVFPSMSKNGHGAIINVSSAAATLGTEGGAIYAASKAAVLVLTKIAAAEWGRHGIRVNAILPGPIETAMLNANAHAEDIAGIVGARVALGRLGEPAEVAAAAVFLASDAASYVTGAELNVDGGRNAALGAFGTSMDRVPPS